MPQSKGMPHSRAAAAVAKPVKAAKFAPSLVVDIPFTAQNGDEAELVGVRESTIQVHDDTDLEKAVRHGWISGPCDCFLTIWAGLGDAIEGGADQVVGMVLLPMCGAVYWLATRTSSGSGGGGSGGWANSGLDGSATSLPPSPPNWSTQMLSTSAHFAQDHPGLYLLVDLGALIGIGLLILFEGDLHRWTRQWRAHARGYTRLERADTPAAPLAAVVGGSKPIKMMREATLRHELHRAIDAEEELDLRLRVRRGSRDDSDLEAGGGAGNAGSDGGGDEGGTADGDARAADDPIGAQLQVQQARRTSLQTALQRHASFVSSPEPRHRGRNGDGCCSWLLESTFFTVFQRALNGLVTVWLYFADVMSDVEVRIALLPPAFPLCPVKV